MKLLCFRYSPKQLYDVVAAVEHYKEFVPWCQRSHILKRENDTFLEAELEVGFRLFVERYVNASSSQHMCIVATAIDLDVLSTAWLVTGTLHKYTSSLVIK